MTSNQGLMVVFVLKNMGFPNGMASSQRVRLIAKSLVEAGAYVRVLCITAGEPKTNLLNKEISGNLGEIPFEYTTGQTYRAERFLMRRWLELKGPIMALWGIWKLRKNEHQNIRLFLYGFSYEPNFSRFAITLIANCLRIPVVLELCEAPWSLGDKRKNMLRNLPVLAGISGVIAISQFLVEWCEKETGAQKNKVRVLRLPILVDSPDSRPTKTSLTEYPSVLLASSQQYDQTVSYVLRAMEFVWKIIPNCSLLITGSINHQQQVSKFFKNANRNQSRVVVTGYIPRDELLRTYRQSWALLVPLFDDVRSIARFPTKIAEYLSSARPIVTTNIGEIPAFFIDGQNAFVAQEITSQAFGTKILDALRDRDSARAVGKKGFDTCLQFFDYSKYGTMLYEFFQNQE